MKPVILVVLTALSLTCFGQSDSQGLNVIAPIPAESMSDYEMRVVILGEAKQSDYYDIKKITDAGWYVHSVLPFGRRIGASSNSVYQEDLMIVFVRPRSKDGKEEKADPFDSGKHTFHKNSKYR